MIKSFITKTRWLVTIILLTTLSTGHVLGAEGDNLYSGTFTGGTDYSYTLNQSLTISGKTWVISSSQKDNSQTKVFFLGCNSTHSDKGILAGTNNTNPNSGGIWDDVVTALRSASTWYNTNYATGHAYAMSMTANYNTVGKITVSWSGVGGPGFAYLFADTGSGLVKLTSGSYANGATTAGSLEYSNTNPGGINISRVVFVYRGGANENSGSTNKTIKITSVVIKEGKAAASCSAPTSPIKGSF